MFFQQNLQSWHLPLSRYNIGSPSCSHKHLAYADAVAYTWGSPAAISDDRLKKSRLLGTCLLHPLASDALPHLYQALAYHDQLPADQWYKLCAAAERDGPQSLLSRWLERYGEQVRRQRPQWQRLLSAVKTQLRAKGIALTTLAAAMAWLARFMPPEESLSGELELEFTSARLALANHQGRVDQSALARLLELGQRLEDENAPAVCQALLRAAVTTTNHFEFSAMSAFIRDWAEKPMAIPGRLNHAKLHSTLGQLAAFEHRHAEAEQHFNQALEAIAPLSDPQQAARETAQISTYQLIARLDAPQADITQCSTELEALLKRTTGRDSLVAVARRFAAGGQAAEVYLHHLLLRACLAYPQPLSHVRDAYLEQSHAWQWHASHPWGLIQAYRGWLLLLASRGNDAERATEHFHAALAVCFDADSGVTLHWMGTVLHALATSLLPGFNAEVPEHGTAARLQTTLPAAPHQAQQALAALSPGATHAERWALLSQCLPFNFH